MLSCLTIPFTIYMIVTSTGSMGAVAAGLILPSAWTYRKTSFMSGVNTLALQPSSRPTQPS